MSISSVQSSPTPPISSNTSTASKVADPAHDGDGDDGASAAGKAPTAAGTGTVVDKTA